MQNIDTTLYEAAEVDGCGPWRRIFVITLPGIRGIILYQMIFIIGGIFTGGNTEEILLFYSDATRHKIETINTITAWDISNTVPPPRCRLCNRFSV